MADAAVSVFYMQPSIMAQPVGTTFTLTLLGSGSADASGAFTGTLDTSAIAPSDLSDDGDGIPDAFNAEVIAIDQAGNIAEYNEVLTLNSTTSDHLSAIPGMAAPPSAGQITQASSKVVGTKYRYIPVTPLNSGYGMKAVLRYTTSSSTAKQTKVDAAASYDGGFSWALTHETPEARDRSATSPYKVTGDFHDWTWASYNFKEYKICITPLHTQVEVCHLSWRPDHFSGTVTNYNPDCCSKILFNHTIGEVRWTVPTFTPGPGGAYYVELTQANSGWTRSSGARAQNTAGGSFTLPFAGTITSNTITTYGSITSLTYDWIASGNCGTGYTRVIWGDNTDPVAADRVQANCEPSSKL